MCSPSDVTQQQTQIPAYRRSVVIATQLQTNEQTKHFREKPPRMAIADRLLSYTTPPNTDSSVPSFRCHSTDSASAQTGHVKAATHRDTALPTQIPMSSPSGVTQQQTQILAYRRSVVIATELRSNKQTPPLRREASAHGSRRPPAQLYYTSEHRFRRTVVYVSFDRFCFRTARSREGSSAQKYYTSNTHSDVKSFRRESKAYTDSCVQTFSRHCN